MDTSGLSRATRGPTRRTFLALLGMTLAGCAAPSAAPAPQPTAPAAAAPTTKPAAAPTTSAPAAAAAAPTTAPATSGGASTSEAAVLNDYYQKAKASGQTKVTHYGLGAEYRALADVFQQKFSGLEVEPVTLRGPEMIQRINAEAASGRYVANAASTGLTTMSTLEKSGMLVKWEPPNAQKLPPPEGGSDGYRWMFTVSLFGIVVNTDLVPAERIPKSRQDLLDPFFKGDGKLLSEDPRAAGGGQSFWVITYDELGMDYLQKIKAQQIALTRERDAAPQQVARGEYMMFFAYGVDNSLLELEQQAPVKVHFFRDGGAHFTDITAGVVKDAPGQDAAKLWISWLTSEEGQRALVDKVKVYAALPGVPAPGGWPTFAEIKPQSRTAAQREKTDEYVKTFEQVFFS
jgi:iron(III) transport system substrate-binding protein